VDLVHGCGGGYDFSRIPDWEESVTCKRSARLHTVCLIGGPRDGTRTLAGGVSVEDMTHEACIAGHDDDGKAYLYAIVGVMQNGELLAVEV
jgi:hypothetical protein